MTRTGQGRGWIPADQHNWRASQILNCNAKVRYRTEAEAMAVHDERAFRGVSNHAHTPYACPVCGGWHMTSKEG